MVNEEFGTSLLFWMSCAALQGPLCYPTDAQTLEPPPPDAPVQCAGAGAETDEHALEEVHQPVTHSFFMTLIFCVLLSSYNIPVGFLKILV